MRNRMYGGVRGRKTKVGRKLLRFPPTRLLSEGEKRPILLTFFQKKLAFMEKMSIFAGV